MSKVFTFLFFSATLAMIDSQEKFSSSYLGASIQLVSHLLHELRYLNPESSRVILVERSPKDNVIYLHYSDSVSSGVKKTKAAEKTLRALMINLHKEAKKIHIDKFLGYTDEMLSNLQISSKLTAPAQLEAVLNHLDSSNFKNATTSQLSHVLDELKNEKSNLYLKLLSLPPLKYLPIEHTN